jgi:hypothetical protein
MSEASIKCLACDHVAPADGGAAPEDGIFACHECGARMPYGKLAPRVVVEPFVDDKGRSWVRHRVQDARTKEEVHAFDLDPQHAAMFAKAILSLVIP